MKNINYYFNDLKACPCSEAFSEIKYPWQALGRQKICLNFKKNDIRGKVDKNVVITGKVTIGKDTNIGPYVVIEGPVKIGKNCTVRPFAMIRPGTIIGNNCVIGKGSEIKNSIIFNEVKIASHAFVGDSILGKAARIGAGTVLANRRFDQSEIYIKICDEKINTGIDKFGAVIGEYCRLGANCVTTPGTLIGQHTWICPAASLGGAVEKDKFIKSKCTLEIKDKKRKELFHLDKKGKI